MKRRCELCSDLATMYCESDSASLCLRCDEKVHGANFLVAKHERSLLCSVCQSVTCWKASGPKLGRTVSVCDICVCARSGGKIDLKEDDEVSAEEEEEEVVVESRDHSGADDEPDASSDDDDDDEDEDDADEDEEIEKDDDEENQVVPWSSGEEVSSSGNGCGERDRKLKRRRTSSDLDSDDEIEDGGGSSSATMQSNRNRATNRAIRLNRFSDRNLREFKPTPSAIRAGNQTSG